jgi:hypothetical protein
MSIKCSPVFATKMTNPAPSISKAEASPNLIEPLTVESRLEKYSHCPIKIPSIDLLITCALPEEGVSSRIVEVEECGDGRHRREV